MGTKPTGRRREPFSPLCPTLPHSAVFCPAAQQSELNDKADFIMEAVIKQEDDPKASESIKPPMIVQVTDKGRIAIRKLSLRRVAGSQAHKAIAFRLCDWS